MTETIPDKMLGDLMCLSCDVLIDINRLPVGMDIEDMVIGSLDYGVCGQTEKENVTGKNNT